MSTTKYFTRFLLLLIILYSNSSRAVNGVPIPESMPNATTASLPTITRTHGIKSTSRKPVMRNPRFFGKFSFLAGLGLPESIPPTITRNDVIANNRLGPTTYTVSYNYPRRRWGPYVAAVYEPLPIWSFFQNPLAYLVAALNPFNWFHGTGTVNAVSAPDKLVVETASPNKGQKGDVLVLVDDSDNTMTNENRNVLLNKMQPENPNNPRTSINTEVPFTKRGDATTSFATIRDNMENIDLMAEDTTLNLFEKIDFENEKDVFRAKQTTRKIKKPDMTTSAKRSKTSRSTTITSTKVISDSYGTDDVPETETGTATTKTTKTTTATTTTTTIGSSNPPNLYNLNTSSALQNFSYPYYNEEHHYQGYPQNVSDIEFTTETTTTNSFVPLTQGNFNEINGVLEQYPANYYDSYDPSAKETFDHYNNRFEQSLPKPTDYYSRNINFLHNNGNKFLLSGFKPSFPFHL